MTTGNETRDGDRLVSETYRELGDERAPEHLNQHVLRMAARAQHESATGRLPFANWMKPAAWAATVGLSLAIFLEFTRLPTATEGLDPVPMISEEAPAAAKMPADRPAAAREASVASDRDSGSGSGEPALQLAPPEPEKQDKKVLETYSRESKGEPEMRAAPAQKLSPAAVRPDTAERQGLQDRSADAPAALLSVVSDQQEADTAEFCNDTQRRSKDDWLACIETLRQSGNNDAATREYEAFLQVFAPGDDGLATE